MSISESRFCLWDMTTMIMVILSEFVSWEKDKKTMMNIIFSQNVGREAGGGSAKIAWAWLNDIHQAGKGVVHNKLEKYGLLPSLGGDWLNNQHQAGIHKFMIIKNPGVVWSWFDWKRRHRSSRQKSAKAHSGTFSPPGSCFTPPYR